MDSKKTNHYVDNFASPSLQLHLGADFSGCCWYGYTESGWVDSGALLIKKSPLKTGLDTCRKNGHFWNKDERKLFLRIDSLDIIVQVLLSRVINKPTQEKIASILETARTSARDNFSATHDGLTGLFNRERFDEDLIRLLKSGSSSSLDNANLAFKPEVTYLLSLDIDHFKSINDKHGHTHGDVVLAAFAWRMEVAVLDFVKSLTSTPTFGVYRLGGEEFQVLISGNITIEDIYRLCSELNKSISSEALPSDIEWHTLSKRAAFAGIDLPHVADRKVTVSIGVAWATLSSGKGAIDLSSKLKRQSDIALYSAKSGGRDRARLFPQILAKYGRILEFHVETGFIAIDIGDDVGVQVGQEFFVFHPDFSGEVEFFAGEGRSRKRLGFYPRLRLGRIRVIDVQREVSFCLVVDINERVSAFVEGSTIEEIPLGSISHLLSSQGGGGNPTSTDVDAVKSIFRGRELNESWIAADFEIFGFEDFHRNKGSAAANLLLARTFDLIAEKFGSKSRIGYVEGSEIVAAVCSAPDGELLNQLSQLISEIEAISGGALSLHVGYCLPSEHLEVFSSLQNEADWSDTVLDLARAARLVANGEMPIVKFSSDAVERLIGAARRDLKHDRAIADFERFSRLGLVSAAIYNQVGLCYAEMTKPDNVFAERHLRSAVKIDPLNQYYLSNLGLIQLISNSFQDAIDSFTICLESNGSLPSSYESAALLSAYKIGGREKLLDYVSAHPSLRTGLLDNRSRQHYVSTADVDNIIKQLGINGSDGNRDG